MYSKPRENITTRNLELDIMKGISIILMIFAHTEYVGNAYNLIYSFHMPLFFLLGGYLSKDNCTLDSFMRYTIKGLKRLLIPYLITMMLICLWIWRFEILKFRFNLSLYPIINLLWGSGDFLESYFGTLYVGPVWFLFNMFITKEIFFLLRAIIEKYNKTCFSTKWIVIITSFIISILSIICYPKIEPIPWDFIPGLGALMFYATGWYMKKCTVPLWMKIVCVICWILAIIFGGIDMRVCNYKLLPLDFVGALGGVYVVYWISKKLLQWARYSFLLNYITLFLRWCGVGSLCVLCMHSLDLMGGVTSYFINLLNLICKNKLSFLSYSTLMCNLLLPMLLTYVITKIPLLRKIFY